VGPETILLVHDDPIFRHDAAQFLKDNDCEIYQTDRGQVATDLIDKISFSVVVTTLRTNDGTTGIDLLVHHEMVSPGGGKILIADFLGNKVDYLVTFIGALCIRPN
jgi:DNA-binding NtrC family response regulator